jgi:hypothetical protein
MEDHRDAALLAAWKIYRDTSRDADWPAAFQVLAGRPAATATGLSVQAQALALIVGADDREPDDLQLLARRLRDGLAVLDDARR